MNDFNKWTWTNRSFYFDFLLLFLTFQGSADQRLVPLAHRNLPTNERYRSLIGICRPTSGTARWSFQWFSGSSSGGEMSRPGQKDMNDFYPKETIARTMALIRKSGEFCQLNTKLHAFAFQVSYRLWLRFSCLLSRPRSSLLLLLSSLVSFAIFINCYSKVCRLYSRSRREVAIRSLLWTNNVARCGDVDPSTVRFCGKPHFLFFACSRSSLSASLTCMTQDR